MRVLVIILTALFVTSCASTRPKISDQERILMSQVKVSIWPKHDCKETGSITYKNTEEAKLKTLYKGADHYTPTGTSTARTFKCKFGQPLVDELYMKPIKGTKRNML